MAGQLPERSSGNFLSLNPKLAIIKALCNFPAVLLLLLQLSGAVVGQNLGDTLNLPEFELKSEFILNNQGFKRTRLDSTILVPRNNSDLGQILSQNSTIFIKSYGNGTLATSSFRGTAAQHTQVQWNGISLNSPMLGQTDLSQIPVSQFDGLEILYGPAGITRTAGAFGGVVDLVTRPDWSNRFNALFSQTYASFNTWKSVFTLVAGTSALQSHTKFSYSTSANDFPYTDNEGNRVKQRNASYELINISQELFWKLKDKHLLSGKLWYSNNYRNLPPPLANSDSLYEENQSDNGFRGVVEYKFVQKKYNLSATSAFVNDNMRYRQADLIDASYRYYSFIQKIRFNYLGIRRLTIRPGVDFSYDLVDADSYEGIKTRSTLSLSADIGYEINHKVNANLVIRQDLVNGTFIPIIPAVGLEYKPWEMINLVFNANGSRNYRMPTLNDMYWELSGNPDLLPEINYSAECGTTWNFSPGRSSFFIEASLSAYYSWIYDMITWLPVDGSNLWEPENIDEVRARGIETGLNFSLEVLNFNLNMKTNYNFCRSTYEKASSANDQKIGKQLIYIPVHTLNSTLTVERWHFYLIYNFYYNSERFTGKDNLSYMPGYNLSNIIFGRNISFKLFVLSLQLDLNNLFNLDYQSIASRPMPGINGALTLKFGWRRDSGK